MTDRDTPPDTRPDARFADADPDQPLMLRAENPDDLPVLSALVQDAVLPVTEIAYDAPRRQVALLINRFRWEDADAAGSEGRPFERVQSLLVLSDVTRLASDGIDRKDRNLILSLLSLDWQPREDGAGTLLLRFAGDGTLAAEAECIAVDLRDVTRPHRAVGGRPSHPD